MKINVGLPSLLFILFLTLKLTGVIAWSWWWVTCPLWAGLAIVVAVIVVAFIGAAVSDLVGTYRRNKRLSK